MELATIPQNSSAMSTTGTNGSPQHNQESGSNEQNNQQKERVGGKKKAKRRVFFNFWGILDFRGPNFIFLLFSCFLN